VVFVENNLLGVAGEREEKKWGVLRREEGHPNIRVSMVISFITKQVINVNGNNFLLRAFAEKYFLLFDMTPGFRYNCALVVA